MTPRRISYAQNAEDIRVWRAFREHDQQGLAYIDVGANEPRYLSITASLHDLGWRGLLIEADPVLAEELRVHRPGDTVVECAAAAGEGELTFYRVPGTGLGTLDPHEAEVARDRGFDVAEVVVPTRSVDAIADEHGIDTVHFMSIDVEGAEAVVLSGLSLERLRPWVICIEAVLPGTDQPSHHDWEPALLAKGYTMAAFDGVNRWYVADEHVDLRDSVATPFNAIDVGEHGWVPFTAASFEDRANRAGIRRAWQRELIMNDLRSAVPTAEYEKQIAELRGALAQVEGSRTFQYARKGAKAARKAQHTSVVARDRMPDSARKALVRKQHLRHVLINQDHLTDPAYLGRPPADVVGWIAPEHMPALPEGTYDLRAFDEVAVARARDWLAAGPYDTDELLTHRIDNHDDELGRVQAALRLRLALAQRPASPHWAGGSKVLVDARCLQTATFGARGIGRFARSALLAVREAVGDTDVVLLVDRGLERLPVDLAGTCEQVTRVEESQVAQYSVLVQPSPMTASNAPLIPLLHSSAHKIAIVFDFIPMHYPTIYLRHIGSRLEYAAALDGLRLFDDYVGISHLAVDELGGFLGRPLSGPGAVTTSVAWPRDVFPRDTVAAASGGTGPIVIMTGDEPRKNTYGALAAVAAATAGDPTREVIVIGMAGQETRVHHWSIAAAMRPGEAITLGRVSDEEMHRTIRDSALVVVASFDEGLSLPVIEALVNGTPVVASDIPAHRELIGSAHLVDPSDLKAFARAIRRTSGSAQAHSAELAQLRRHQHDDLEDSLARRVVAHRKAAVVDLPHRPVTVSGHRLSVGFATPWPPQRSGVADFSYTTCRELAALCDLTVYTTADAVVEGLAHRPVDELLAQGHDHDVLVTVVGNSHFHLPFVEVLRSIDAVAVAHDTRMVELYLALRGPGGVEQVMLRGQAQRTLRPPLDDQIDDMRLLQNAGFWEIANRAQALVMHSPSAAPRIADETGVTPHVLPFANQRFPEEPVVTDEMRRAARERLGFDAGDFAGTVHLATFGFVDVRTKMIDTVVESAAWLSQWGHRVSLHLAGSASESDAAILTRRAADAGIANFRITGFLTDDEFRDHLLAVDLGLQLRVSPMLGVSGPLSDLAAYGTTSLASNGLCVDVATPGYVDRLPDDVSPVIVAEAIEHRLRHPHDPAVKERQRVEYLERQSPRHYAEALMAVLQEMAARS